MKDSVFIEESNHFDYIQKEINTVIINDDQLINQLSTSIQDDIGFDDQENIKLKINHRKKCIDERNEFQKYKKEPYYGRIDIDKNNSTTRYYIGKNSIVTLNSIKDGQCRDLVYDWRSPIGNAYRNEQFAYYKEKNDEFFISLRRNFDIKNGRFLDYHTRYDANEMNLSGEVVDPFLIQVLRDKRRDYELTDIIKTIQSEQNNIMTLPMNKNFIVQGCAGSGKTMILLHRLSYLVFNNSNYDWSKAKVLTPNELFDKHIQTLCDDLEIDMIKRYSVEQYYKHLLDLYFDSIKGKMHNESELSCSLLKEIYSTDLYNKIIDNYYSYWKDGLYTLKSMDLSQIFNKYNLSFPTNITYDSYGYNKINEISLTLSKLNDKYESDINALTEKENTISKSLSKEQNILQEQQIQMNNLYKSLNKELYELLTVEQEIFDELTDKMNVIQESKDNIDKRVVELTDEITELEKLSVQQDIDYSSYEAILNNTDYISKQVVHKLSDEIEKIKELETQLSNVPSYNFGKMSRIRKELSNLKSLFVDSASIEFENQKEQKDTLLTEKRRERSLLGRNLEGINKDFNKELIKYKKEAETLNLVKVTIDLLLNNESVLYTPLLNNKEFLFEEKMYEYASYCDQYRKLNDSITNLQSNKENLILERESIDKNKPSDEEQNLINEYVEKTNSLTFSNIYKNIVVNEIKRIYEKLGIKYEEIKYKHTYLYRLLLRVLYDGPLNRSDKFLCIDEAQDLSPIEYKILQKCLDKDCVFNIYGDLNQLVYTDDDMAYKGLDDWCDIGFIDESDIYVMQENYRNTFEVTQYCNDVFGAEITPIGLHGKPVEFGQLQQGLAWLKNNYDHNRDARFAVIYGRKSNLIEPFKNELPSYMKSLVEMLSVESAKGLEFDFVLVLEDNMEYNERYISYTRTLNGLFIVSD